MAERCPLSEIARPGAPVDIPDICDHQCGRLIDEASRGPGEYDSYLRDEPIPDGEVQYSHSAIGISSLKNAVHKRFYVVVDECITSHGGAIEIGETAYEFNCPHA